MNKNLLGSLFQCSKYNIMKTIPQQWRMLDPNLDERDRQTMGCNVTMFDLSYTFAFFLTFKSTNLCVYDTYKEENQL